MILTKSWIFLSWRFSLCFFKKRFQQTGSQAGNSAQLSNSDRQLYGFRDHIVEAMWKELIGILKSWLRNPGLYKLKDNMSFKLEHSPYKCTQRLGNLKMHSHPFQVIRGALS